MFRNAFKFKTPADRFQQQLTALRLPSQNCKRYFPSLLYARGWEMFGLQTMTLMRTLPRALLGFLYLQWVKQETMQIKTSW
jgi:ubiquinone biosynthesis protein Coq4